MGDRRAVLCGLVALGGCGFRPMLKRGDEDAGVRDQLSAIEVEGLQSDRVSQLVRNGLLDQLDPTSAAVANRYVLTVTLRQSTSALGIQLDNTITRYNLSLVANFALLEAGTRRRLYDSSVRRVSSYNVSREPFADLVAEERALERAAREVSTEIANLLAVHFTNQSKTV